MAQRRRSDHLTAVDVGRVGPGHDVEIARPLTAGTLRWLLRFGIESRPFRAQSAATTVYAPAPITATPGLRVGLTIGPNASSGNAGILALSYAKPMSNQFGGTPGTPPTPQQVSALRSAAERLLPSIKELATEGTSWRGARPMTASGLPIVGRCNANTFAATGHGTLGMTLAPATARTCRDLVLRSDD